MNEMGNFLLGILGIGVYGICELVSSHNQIQSIPVALNIPHSGHVDSVREMKKKMELIECQALFDWYGLREFKRIEKNTNSTKICCVESATTPHQWAFVCSSLNSL